MSIKHTSRWPINGGEFRDENTYTLATIRRHRSSIENRNCMPSQKQSEAKRSTIATKLRLLNQVAFDRRSTRLFSSLFYRSTGSEPEEYAKWYFNNMVWQDTTWMGVETYKSPCDMWNYQEILCKVKPSLIIEFGTAFGGSALFWTSVMRQIGAPFKVLSVDISHSLLRDEARRDPDVEFVESSSIVPAIADRIRQLRNEYPGKVFAILDSDHSMDHVLAEMKQLRPLLSSGDYLIVEDSLLNGHPVAPEWGPGPYEAIEAYEKQFPDDYTHDTPRADKFGWSFAPYGFLIRN